MMNQAETIRSATAEMTVGQVVAEDYRTARVFERYGIDFCCGGQATLTAACSEKGLDPAALRREIEAAKSTPLERGQNFAAWDLAFLADYIVNTHHAYLNENIGQIAAYARKIAAVHGAHHPEVIEVATVFDAVAAEMAVHLREEEDVLFPAIRRLEAARKGGVAPEGKDREAVSAALQQLGAEHDRVGEAVHTIHRLTGGYAIPDGVCNTFVVTYRKLKEFEDDLHKHVHLENNILFPKAAQL